MATAGERWDWTSAVAMEQVADIVYTSGTSGNPKGVALTHGNLAFTVKSLTDGTEDVICNHDVLLMGLPFFHIFGKAVMLTALSRQLAVARQGGKVDIVILPSLSKAVQNLDGVIKTIHDYQVTILPSVPVFLEKLVEYLERHPAKKPLVSSLKTIISGGAALKAQTYDALKAINPEMRILEGYGSSEAGINLLNKPGISGFVGTPLPGVQTQLDVSGEDPTVGELLVKSDGVSAGYVLGTTESADRTIADAQGWFRTGDIVRHDPAVGYKIIGRDSFFIKIDNEKRSPEELEEAVRLASEAITDAMVVAHLAGSIHEQAVAVVTTEDTTLDEAAIKKAMDHLATKNQITRWKIPKHILVLHQPKMPERFDNGFKREAGYKVIRQFINEALALRDATGEPVVIFHEKSDTHKRPWTEIRTPQAYHELIQKYNTAS
jgi:long-subunit acyl-CoA synthetase (AMP-forming)